MEAVSVCKHFKFGHCKFGNYCRNRHVATICDDVDCDISLCENRHPKVCKFYQNFGRCKFTPCSFKHEENEFEKQSRNIKNLEHEFRAKTVEIENIKMEIAKLTKLCDLLSERLSNKNVNVCTESEVKKHSLQQEACTVVTKLDTVVADVASLKELTDLLKLQNEVSDDDFHAYSLVVDQLEEKVLHIEKTLHLRPASTPDYVTQLSILPTPPPSKTKARP